MKTAMLAEDAVTKSAHRRRPLTGIVLALVGPPILGFIFIPLFRTIQETFGPKGNLEGRDLTTYAQRDQLLFNSFAVFLVLLVLLIAWRAPGWSFRMATFFVGIVAVALTLIGVFFGLMAG